MRGGLRPNLTPFSFASARPARHALQNAAVLQLRHHVEDSEDDLKRIAI
jgi:hypothetical protein